MPWFGLDIGGTLTKLVYFDPCSQDPLYEEDVRVGKTIRRYLLNNKAYGETGIRDEHLQLNNVNINGQDGSIHFICFPTEKMFDFIRLVKSKGFTQLSSTVCATGGGAYKYALQIENVRTNLIVLMLERDYRNFRLLSTSQTS
jgi:type II pantothenate kinase